jgi:hypothetical protein
MNRKISTAVIGAVALLGSVFVGGSAAYAAPVTPTLVITGGSAVFGLDPAAVNATASAPGVVKFYANAVVIPGCEAVATKTVTPFVAVCMWTPLKAGLAGLSGTLTPTDLTAFTVVDSAVLNVKAGIAIQTSGASTGTSPISIFVDTILTSGMTGVLAPRFNGCAVMNEFLLGQKILFRVYANNADQGNAVMDPSNTAKAYVEVAGLKDPIQMVYRNHSGVAFWSGLLVTGTGPGQYSTLGTIVYKVVMTAKDSTSIKVLSTKLSAKKVDGKRVIGDDGRTVYERVSYYRSVPVSPALKGSTGTYYPDWAATSKLTLFAVPVAK